MRHRRNKKTVGESLAILDANAGNLSQTARLLKMPKSTLKGWRDTKASDEVIARYRTVKNEELAEGFRVMSAMALERLIDEMAYVDRDKLATIAAIGVDKQLLLSGQPATNDGTVERSELAAILQSAMDSFATEQSISSGSQDEISKSGE